MISSSHRSSRQTGQPSTGEFMESHAVPGSAIAAVKSKSVVFAKMAVSGIDMRHPMLTPENVELLHALSERQQDYIRHGRGREAHAMASAMLIVWRAFCKPDILLDPPTRSDLPR